MVLEVFSNLNDSVILWFFTICISESDWGPGAGKVLPNPRVSAGSVSILFFAR